jgi:LAO/AO transport system kinase
MGVAGHEGKGVVPREPQHGAGDTHDRHAVAGPAPLVARVLAGDVRAVARLITLLENEDATAPAALAALYPHTGRARTIGITGAAGSGKSTLVDALVHLLRAEGLTVAVVAVDPSSPYSGGAVLGDRIRMGGHAGDPGVFIRSMGARGHLGGLARATDAALLALDAAGWQVIVVETVGVGQSELDIAALADVTVVLLTPAAGDAVQLLKAGLLEVAGLLVVNKSDLPGAERLARDLRAMVTHRSGAAPAIVRTEATAGEGVEELWAALQASLVHGAPGASRDVASLVAARRRAVAARRILAAALATLERDVTGLAATPGSPYAPLLDAVVARTLDPQAAARRVLDWWRTGGP